MIQVSHGVKLILSSFWVCKEWKYNNWITVWAQKTVKFPAEFFQRNFFWWTCGLAFVLLNSFRCNFHTSKKTLPNGSNALDSCFGRAFVEKIQCRIKLIKFKHKMTYGLNFNLWDLILWSWVAFNGHDYLGSWVLSWKCGRTWGV